MSKRRNDDGPNPAMIFIILSVVFVLLTVLAFGALLLLRQVNFQSALGGDTIPYNLAVRPVPNAKTAADLLPQTLGNFKRGAITGNIQDFQTTYTNGTDKIQLSGSQTVSLVEAQAFVSMFEQANKLTGKENHLLNSDPSFVEIQGATLVQLAWSHNRYYFAIKAPSQAALDAFMQVFKY
jgi:hypothetical protein